MFEPNPAPPMRYSWKSVPEHVRRNESPIIRSDGRDPTYVMMGANGDICAMLPFFWKKAQELNRPTKVLVSRQYAPIFGGTSYVDPVIFNGHYGECQRAIADNRHLKLHCVQTYGVHGDRKEDSFVKDMWRNVECASEWDDWPLIFDKRNEERELALLKQINPDGMPLILVGCSGKSSPFNHSKSLIRKLSEAHPEHLVFDLSTITADRIYDLLGLYDSASLLVSADTSHIHMSRASGVPVIGLATHLPTAWHGAPRYKNQKARFRYHDYLVIEPELIKRSHRILNKSVYSPRLIHAYSDYARSGGSLDRYLLAKQTWDGEYKFANWIPCPIRDEMLTRTSKSAVGDSRVLPFMKDIVDFAVEQSVNDEDLIVLTNDDTCWTPGLTQQILAESEDGSPLFAHRWDFNKLSRPLNPSEVKKGKWYPGSDLFIFSVGWWKMYRDDMPDLILACEYWDCILRQMMKRSGGKELQEVIYHEWHDSVWQRPGFRNENIGQKYNVKLATEWFKSHNSNDGDPMRQVWFHQEQTIGKRNNA